MGKRLFLYIDILGFREYTKKNDPDDIYQVISKSQAFAKSLAGDVLRAIYFSDTIILWQNKEDKDEALTPDSLLRRASALFNVLLSQKIPIVGIIHYGDFHVRRSSTYNNVFFGQGLIEAYDAEKKERGIGIIVSSSVFGSELQVALSGRKFTYLKEYSKFLVRRPDGSYNLNPFSTIKEAFENKIQDDDEELYLSLKALQYIVNKANKYIEDDDFYDKVAARYHLTRLFIKDVLGVECFEWAINQE